MASCCLCLSIWNLNKNVITQLDLGFTVCTCKGSSSTSNAVEELRPKGGVRPSKTCPTSDDFVTSSISYKFPDVIKHVDMVAIVAIDQRGRRKGACRPEASAAHPHAIAHSGTRSI